MNDVKFTKLAAVLGALVVAGSACAADSGTGTVGVSASIAPECAVAQNTAINFATLSMLDSVNAAPSNADSVQAGAVNAICTTGTPLPTFRYTSANGLANAFRMVGIDTTTFIPYTLHQDGTASLGAVTYDTAAAHPDFVADGTTNVLPVSARVLAADKAGKAMQTYSDTITITTSFDS
jgi:spore coat protein U-like protein